ncbi:hypothetical protein CAPTEDRAFT_178145 [Capitella teleta]|uniref:Large ribosomal subunit protein mL50 n=1 Tax=Capitella teleta TaxID=283909 RepID=R7UCF0_CAPTE|nr:hypothetical protein CAPTEDRAFT_178145 [Capitella teleta]|eukprot:ELU04055.1 hypothetical protein CAPTEDRAFT_178145 [Capitella teleta]
MQEYMKFWQKQKPTEEEAARLVDDATEKRSPSSSELKSLAKHNLNLLKAKQTIDTKKAYKPPSNVEDRVRDITVQTCLHLDPKSEEWRDVTFNDDPTIKFKVLSKLIKEFSHDIPSSNMHQMNSIQDAIQYFQTEVSTSSSYENLEKLDLPRNLNLKLEYTRFDPSKQATAFPGQDTVVTSLKYKRKYESIKCTEEKSGYVNHYYGY